MVAVDGVVLTQLVPADTGDGGFGWNEFAVSDRIGTLDLAAGDHEFDCPSRGRRVWGRDRPSRLEPRSAFRRKFVAELPMVESPREQRRLWPFDASAVAGDRQLAWRVAAQLVDHRGQRLDRGDLDLHQNRLTGVGGRDVNPADARLARRGPSGGWRACGVARRRATARRGRPRPRATDRGAARWRAAGRPAIGRPCAPTGPTSRMYPRRDRRRVSGARGHHTTAAAPHGSPRGSERRQSTRTRGAVGGRCEHPVDGPAARPDGSACLSAGEEQPMRRRRRPVASSPGQARMSRGR